MNRPIATLTKAMARTERELKVLQAAARDKRGAAQGHARAINSRLADIADYLRAIDTLRQLKPPM